MFLVAPDPDAETEVGTKGWRTTCALVIGEAPPARRRRLDPCQPPGRLSPGQGNPALGAFDKGYVAGGTNRPGTS